MYSLTLACLAFLPRKLYQEVALERSFNVYGCAKYVLGEI